MGPVGLGKRGERQDVRPHLGQHLRGGGEPIVKLLEHLPHTPLSIQAKIAQLPQPVDIVPKTVEIPPTGAEHGCGHPLSGPLAIGAPVLRCQASQDPRPCPKEESRR